MNYAEIKTYDIANGPGVRTSLFVSGCTHHCQNCFNEMTWDFNYGQLFTEETMDYLLETLKPDYVKGLTLLGGEPLERVNQKGLLPLLRKVREIYPEKNVWCFTGYTYETDVLGRMCKEWEETEELLSYIDVLVDGKFIQEQKQLGLKFRGSTNQRLIRIPESQKEGKIVLWEE